jgi:hypothetical protein
LKVKKINKGFSKNIKIVIAIGLYSYVIRTHRGKGRLGARLLCRLDQLAGTCRPVDFRCGVTEGSQARTGMTYKRQATQQAK